MKLHPEEEGLLLSLARGEPLLPIYLDWLEDHRKPLTLLAARQTLKSEPRAAQDLQGLVLCDAREDPNTCGAAFTLIDGRRYGLLDSMLGSGCDVSVTLEDVCGDLKDLIGLPLTQCEEVTNLPEPSSRPGGQDSYAWTFYRLATGRGAVTLRFYGESNGYYSEGVAFEKLPDGA